MCAHKPLPMARHRLPGTLPRWLPVACVAAALLLLGLAGNADYSAEQAQHRLYCDKVEEWQLTGGVEGWPDFKGTFKEHCR